MIVFLAIRIIALAHTCTIRCHHPTSPQMTADSVFSAHHDQRRRFVKESFLEWLRSDRDWPTRGEDKKEGEGGKKPLHPSPSRCEDPDPSGDRSGDAFGNSMPGDHTNP
jgi:hypothetical protein